MMESRSSPSLVEALEMLESSLRQADEALIFLSAQLATQGTRGHTTPATESVLVESLAQFVSDSPIRMAAEKLSYLVALAKGQTA